MKSLENKTVFISGASRGIGRAIALKLACRGANIIVAAKTVDKHPKLSGTIHTVVEEIKSINGHASAVQMDIRSEDEVNNAVSEAINEFGSIDILINNASAIDLSPSEFLPIKKYDLMHQVNVRGTYILTTAVLPFLKKSDHAHILNLSPPLNMDSRWFENHVAYTMTKYGMSMCVLGMAEEYKKYNIAVNALWPRTTIDTAAIRNMPGGDQIANQSRKPKIVADAAFCILSKDPSTHTGNFYIDQDVLEAEGITDFGPYAVQKNSNLMDDFFL